LQGLVAYTFSHALDDEDSKETYGAAFVDYFQGRTPTKRAFTGDEKEIYQEIQNATDRITELVAQQKSLPERVPLAQAQPNQKLVKLSTERKHLTNVLKLVAYQVESDLANLIRPHYARANDEGRTLIQSALQSTAALEPVGNELRITLALSVLPIAHKRLPPCAKPSTKPRRAFLAQTCLAVRGRGVYCVIKKRTDFYLGMSGVLNLEFATDTCSVLLGVASCNWQEFGNVVFSSSFTLSAK
jgi:hypothetical protein